MTKKKRRIIRHEKKSISALAIIIAVIIALIFVTILVKKSPQKRSLTLGSKNSTLLTKGYVLGEEIKEEEKKSEEAKKEQEKSNEEQKKAEEKKQENVKKTETVLPTLAPKNIKVKTQAEGNKNETEVETLDGQKIKTKVEDDGSAKIEMEHKKLKIKFEIRNGQMVTKTEDKTGKEVELDKKELDKLEDEIENELEKDGIKISTGGAGLISFAKNQIAATTNFPLSINVGTKQLVVTTPAGQKVVAVLPDQAVNNLLATGVINKINTTLENIPTKLGTVSGVVEFTIKNEEPVYEVKGFKTYKLFALIPVTQPVTAVVSSQTGALITVEKSFLTNIIDLLSP